MSGEFEKLTLNAFRYNLRLSPKLPTASFSTAASKWSSAETSSFSSWGWGCARVLPDDDVPLPAAGSSKERVRTYSSLGSSWSMLDVDALGASERGAGCEDEAADVA